jgi:signal transduction histidine kinase
MKVTIGGASRDWKNPIDSETGRLIVSVSLPFLAFAMQSSIRIFISPFAWFLFFPAVFFSSWISGLRGAVPAALISTGLAWWFFIPPERSFALDDIATLGSILLFLLMGLLFGYSNERIKRANRETVEALEAAKIANDSLREANVEITLLYEKTKEIDRLKTQLFSNISHELRTPLTLILGPVDKRLTKTNIPEDERRDLETIRRNARLLYRHISDLLDVSKLDAGRMTVRWTAIDLSRLARFVVSHFESAARERCIAIKITAPETFPAYADAEKIERVLLNLLSNAFRFSPNGGTVELSLSAENGRAVIRVRDEGPGVPENLREEIFERFVQGDGGPERRYGGTGLGLAIAKEFVELHGGSIKATDASGSGNYRIARACDGEEGLEKALELQPDLILTDVMMPRMDGERLVEAVRGIPELDTVPIVILSAKADEESRIRLLKNGAQDYINKPFSADELSARVARLLAERKRAWERLRESERLLRAIIDNASKRMGELIDGLLTLSRSTRGTMRDETVARLGIYRLATNEPPPI